MACPFYLHCNLPTPLDDWDIVLAVMDSASCLLEIACTYRWEGLLTIPTLNEAVQRWTESQDGGGSSLEKGAIQGLYLKE